MGWGIRSLPWWLYRLRTAICGYVTHIRWLLWWCWRPWYDIGLFGQEGLGSPLHSQLFLGIVIQVLGGRIDLDVQDDSQSRIDLGFVNQLPCGSGDDPDHQSRDQNQDKLLICVDEVPIYSFIWLFLRWCVLTLSRSRCRRNLKVHQKQNYRLHHSKY